MPHTRIQAADLFSTHTAGDICVLDLRTAAEVKSESLTGTLHIPLHQLSGKRLEAELIRLGKNPDTIYLLCQSGKRAEAAATQLANEAVKRTLCIIDGGLNGLKQAGIEVQQQQNVMSLERQVRIAAGSLVLLGAGLGFAVNPAFFGLSAFIGAGLIFAGVTNTCAMGMLIARMPWNQ